MTEEQKRSDTQSSLKRAVIAIKEMREKLEAAEHAQTEPIAIVGMACRFPGDANSPDAFWKVMVDGVDAISEVPPNRWDIDAYYDSDPDAVGKMYTREAGFLSDVDLFDAEFFGITPREAKNMDPQQRLLLEVSWEALENSGIAAARIRQSWTGIFVGISTNDYLHLQMMNNPGRLNAYAGTGGFSCVAAGRLSYFLGLHGPSIAIDTACSSSLVAVDLAVQHLRTRKCHFALAGGVNLILSPELSISFSRLKALSADGRCKTFDAAADGYGRGEGCAIIALKRLSDAIADGDTIKAIIRGSAVNNDGPSSGLTVPNGPAQQKVIRAALADGRVDPGQVNYVEAHGTGTALGDPLEIGALCEVLGEGHSKEKPLMVGTVKANIGHLEAAAGMAGLIKSVLCMQHAIIPPQLHFTEPNHHIAWEKIPVKVAPELTPWKQGDGKRTIGVSAFGFSGTNAHVILQEAPTVMAAESEFERPLHLLLLSAKSEIALNELALRYADQLLSNPSQPAGDFCFTANVGRTHFSERLAVIGESSAHLQQKLTAFAEEGGKAGMFRGSVSAAGRPKIAFLFTGQGSQYLGMARQLYDTQPSFRRVLDKCNKLLHPYLENSLLEVLHPKTEFEAEAEELLNQTAYTQPALFALEYALAELWLSWGVKPRAVMGHSVGEYVAACVAGVFSLEDGLKLIAARGRLMQALPAGGAMVAVFADELKVAEVISDYSESVSIAALNGPQNTVISGTGTAIQAIIEKFTGEGIKSRPLDVSHAFHSPLMEPMLSEFEKIVSGIKFTEPKMGIISNLTGRSIAPGEISQAAYWCRHVRSPVKFSSSVKALHENGYKYFVEIGPHPVLLGMAARCLPESDSMWLPSLRKGRGDWQQLFESLGSLHLHGIEIDWFGFDRDYPRRKLSLPNYPFQRERYWLEQKTSVHNENKSQPVGHKIEILDHLYEIDWQPTDFAENILVNEQVDRQDWLIFADDTGYASSLAETINDNGGTCATVSAGDHFHQLNKKQFTINPLQLDHYERLLKIESGSRQNTSLGIVYLWPLNTSEATTEYETADMEHDQKLSCGGVINLFKALDSCQMLNFSHIWIVTQGVQSKRTDHLPNLAQSPLWGLSRTIMLEHPEIMKGIIDLGEETANDAAQYLLSEILSNDGEYQVCYTNGFRYVARLKRAKEFAAEPISIFSDETYLITGGLGALGLQLADWLVAKGARHIVLCSRSAPSSSAKRKIDHLSQMGCNVTVRKIDVSCQRKLTECIGEITQLMPPLSGVIHAAGVLDDGVLLNQNIDRFSKVLAPKVSGAWNLHLATKDLSLRFFVLFSSAASIIGSASQGNYAAANSFLDTLAVYRRQQGLPALSIAWGPWSDRGMASELNAQSKRRLSQRGLKNIHPEIGFHIIESVIGSRSMQICAMETDWTAFFSQVSSKIILPFFTVISAEYSTEKPAEPNNPSKQSPLERWREKKSEQRFHFLEAYLRELVSRAIGLEKNIISSESDFNDIGLDSIMIMEIINDIRQDFHLSLYATEIFKRPTIHLLAEYIESELNQKTGLAISENQPAQTLRSAFSFLRSGKRTNKPSKDSNPTMVFLLSSPRAGSTLLRVMLAGHPQLFCPPELHLLPFNNLEERNDSLGRAYLTEGLEHAVMELKGIGVKESQNLVLSWIENGITTQSIYRLLQDDSHPRLLVDKSPTYALNIENLEWAESIFESPKYIHLARHPLSVIESFVRKRMDRLLGIETDDPSRVAEQIWCEANANIIDFFEGIDPSRQHRVYFEELVQNPEKIMTGLCSFLELPFEETLLKPYKGNRMTDGLHSSSVVIGDPDFLNHDSIDASLADSWQKVTLGHKPGGYLRRVAMDLGYDLPAETAATEEKTGLQTPVLRPVNRDKEIPLSFQQQRLWFLEKLEPGKAVYNMPALVFRISGTLNEKALRKSLDEIIHRHEILRTTFPDVDGKPVQVIASHGSINLTTIDLGRESDDLQMEKALDLIAGELKSPFDLQTGPLFRAVLIRLKTDENILAFPIHHIVSDGWSFGLFLRELRDLYNSFDSGKPSRLPALSIQYADFAHWQRKWLSREVIEDQVAYWKRKLGNDVPVLQLPTDRPRPAVQAHRGAKESFVLSEQIQKGLNKLSQQEGATLFMTLLAAFKTLLFRYSGQEDIVIGSPIANRNRSEIEDLIGFFVNTLVLRGDLSGNPSFKELLGRMREVALGAYDHQDLPFEKLVEELQPERDMSHTPLFQVMFVLQNISLETRGFRDLTLSRLAIETGTAKFDLTLTMREGSGGLTGSMEYNTDLFNRATIIRMIGHFQTLLKGILADPEERISQLPFLTEAERHQLLIEWNDAAPDYPKEKSIHTWFEQQVERTPDAVAVAFEEQQLTYRELNQRANQLAHYLRALGVGPEVLVAIYAERSIEMLYGILGILKAGGAYVPLDPVYPKERLAFMMDDAQTPVLLTQERLVDNLPAHDAKVLLLDADWDRIAQETKENPPCEVTADNLAYVIFTSGSTGKPKGVQISHYNVVRLLEATHDWYHFDQNDVWTLFHSYAFDFSVWEIWGALLYGGKLVMVPYLTSRSPDNFYNLLREEGVTVLNQTPTAFYQLIQAEESMGGEHNLSLRLVIFGGEALDLQGLKPWFERHGDKAPQLVNMYGITETTVHVTYRPLYASDVDAATGSVIGVPIPDLQLYVLDSHHEPVPVGVPGEMYVGGAGVARGYLNRPELTADRFIPNPFRDDPAARLYKTGDLARFLPDRDIEYLGRIDHQVQIRGFRVELGEIEAVLGHHSAVGKAVVIERESAGFGKRLVAYLVLNQRHEPTISELRNFLKEKLPDYMIPSAFVFLDTLPLTPNGKVDSKALPAPDGLRKLEAAYIAPQTEVEKTISAVWQETLNMEKVGIHDNFFDLGGHSLLLVQVHTKLRECLDTELPIVKLFQYPTINALGKYLSQGLNGPPVHQKIFDRTERQKAVLARQKRFMKKSKIIQDTP